MSIKNLLLSKISTDMSLEIHLHNGTIFKGHTKHFDEDSLILWDNDQLFLINPDDVVAWNISCPEELIPNFLPDGQVMLPTPSPSESPTQAQTLDILKDFIPEHIEHIKIEPEPPINKPPYTLIYPESSEDKKKWDSIMSRYQNALKSDNLTVLDSLCNELLEMLNRHPTTGALYYNASCFKLHSYDYYGAAELSEKALGCCHEPKYAYNTAAAYLTAGSFSKANIFLCAYYFLEDKIQDTKLWQYCCSLSVQYQQQIPFAFAFGNILEKLQYEDLDSLKFIIKSGLYVLSSIPEIKDMLIAFYNQIDTEEIDDIEEMLEHYQLSYIEMLETLFKEDITDILPLSFLPEQVHKENTTITEEEPISLSSINKVCSQLKRGYIYRAIPPNHYGFLNDTNGNSCHFKYDAIVDNVGYLDSVSDLNPFPVFFISKPADIPNPSTPETAVFICSDDFLDNMFALAQEFAKERNYPNALMELEVILNYVPDHKNALEAKERWTKIYESKYQEKTDKIDFTPETNAGWETKGHMLLKLGMYNDAIDAFNMVSASNTKSSSSSLYGKGLAYLNKREYDQAHEFLDKCLERNPLHYHALFVKGVLYNRIGEYKDAIQCFNEVLQKRPDYVRAMKEKAFSQFRLEKYTQAIETYKQVMVFEPENWLELSRLSSVYIKNKQYQHAMKCINIVLEHEPENPAYLFIKGYVYQMLNKYNDALYYFNLNLEIDPTNIKTLTKKAFVLAVNGQSNEAVETINAAYKLNMNHPKTWYYKGVVHHYAGDYQEAIKAYNYSLDLDPGVQRVISCRERAIQKLGSDSISDSIIENTVTETTEKENIGSLISDLNSKYSLI
jgi:tetratricopeptide (TPR) repeat protein